MIWNGSPQNLMAPVANVYVLPRATIALYQDLGAGVPGPAAITMKQLENVRIADRYDSVRTAFTGVPHPEPFHTTEQHEISADGMFDVARVMQRNTDYILVVTLNAATLGNGTASPWVRFYYYKARTDAMEMSARDANEFVGSQTITASFRKTESGSGTPGALQGCDDLSQ